jgi:hypothetical protein
MDRSDEARLHELLAKQEITEVVYRLAHAYDRADHELAASCYHPDATENHGLFDGPAERFIAEVARPIAASPTRRSLWRTVTSVLVEVDGDVARAESHVFFFGEAERDGEPVDTLTGSRYLDRFERRQGRWAITHRDVVLDWSREIAPRERVWVESEMAGHGFLQGAYGMDDPSYTRLHLGGSWPAQP